MDTEEFKAKWDERMRDLMANGPPAYMVQKPIEKPIDWCKVAARIRSDGEDAERQLADQRDTETVTAVATIVIMCQVLAAAIEDGLS